MAASTTRFGTPSRTPVGAAPTAAVDARSRSGVPAIYGYQLRFGRIWVDVLTREQALEGIRRLVRARQGGAIFTPNVDHVVMANGDRRFRQVYRRASLTFADGVPLVWASKLMRPRLPEKLSGSDMVEPIARLAAAEGWRVYLLGGMSGSAAEAGRRLTESCGVTIAGADDARVSVDGDPAGLDAIVERIRAARPHVVFVALGAPKQELFIDRVRDAIAPAVSIGVGASLDFIAGRVKRAPAWMSRLGLEWVHRFAQEPQRLWRRYLLRDPAFAFIVLRTLRLRRSQRVRIRGTR